MLICWDLSWVGGVGARRLWGIFFLLPVAILFFGKNVGNSEKKLHLQKTRKERRCERHKKEKNRIGGIINSNGYFQLLIFKFGTE